MYAYKNTFLDNLFQVYCVLVGLNTVHVILSAERSGDSSQRRHWNCYYAKLVGLNTVHVILSAERSGGSSQWRHWNCYYAKLVGLNTVHVILSAERSGGSSQRRHWNCYCYYAKLRTVIKRPVLSLSVGDFSVQSRQ